jgi:hypothetical protein
MGFILKRKKEKKLDAGLAQLVEQLFCKQQVIGSNPVASSRRFLRKLQEVRFRSGQTGQTVNLVAQAFEGSIPSLTTIFRNGTEVLRDRVVFLICKRK